MSKETVKHETREAILDAAERLMDRYGYSKMTMNDLAEEARIGVGTTYLHFSSKADVALGVVERFHKQVLRTLAAGAAGDGPPDRRLREMLIARIMLRFDAMRQHKHPMDEFKNAVHTGIETRRMQWAASEIQIAQSLLEEGQAAGLLRPADSAATAEMLICATCGLMPKHLTPDDFAHPTRVREKIENLTDLLMRALQTCSLPDAWLSATTEETVS